MRLIMSACPLFAIIYGRTYRDWLYRQADTLPFTVRIGRSLGFSEQGIEKWLRQRAGR
jgi:predicted DNA-binding transcriptional regulator AlpA